MDLQLSGLDEDTVSFKPNAARTIAVLPPNSGTDLTPPHGLTFIIDTTASSTGDELVLVTQQFQSVFFYFRAVNGIILLSCGEITGAFQSPERWTGHFWFDGTIFTNFYDNC